MRIVVLMSTYNGDKYLKEQIDSILNQKGCEVELLVRDDMSTDKTLEILEEYQQQGKLRWYREDVNLGAAKSFWKLLMDAPDAEYYSFADQDDVWKPDKLFREIECIKHETGPALSYSNAELVDAQMNSLGDVVYHGEQKPTLMMALCSCNILGCTIVMNRKMMDIIKGMKNPEHIIMHDSFIGALCMASGGHIYYDNNSNMYYRQHGNNVVGVSINHSLIERIKDKWGWIMKDRKVSICDQCKEIASSRDLTVTGRRCVNKVSDYKNNWYIRLQLAWWFIRQFATNKATKHELLTSIAILFSKA